MVAAPVVRLRAPPRLARARPEPGASADPEAACAALAAAGAPLRRALARLAGRLVATRGWEPLGFARAGDYARERLGISGRELHELAQVDRALARLPALDAAFAAGRLPWSKLRLLCRVAEPADEALWLRGAQSMSAAALAREVRAVDVSCVEHGGAALAEDEDADACETVRIRAPAWLRARWGGVQRLARCAEGSALPTWRCAEAVAAEVLSALPLELDPGLGAGRERMEGTLRGDPLSVPLPAQPPESPETAAVVAGLCAGLDGADPRVLDARLRRAMALERGWLVRLGPLLARVAAERLYRDVGCLSLDAWARERLGMCPRTARALLRLERACLLSPALARAWRGGELLFSQALLLVRIAVQEHAASWLPGWIARAREVTVRRLDDDVMLAVETGDLDPAHLPALPPGLQIGARPRDSEANVTLAIGGPRDAIRLFRATLATVQRRIERAERRPCSPAEGFAAMLDHVEEAWGARRAVPREHAVFARDGWRCTVPGCSSYRNLHAHHIAFRSRGGDDADENLVTLCAFHHLRGVHARRLRISGRAPLGLRFELPLESFRSGDVRMG